MVKYILIGSALLALFITVVPQFSPVEAKCGAKKPGSAPVLVSAVAGDQSVTLSWSKAAEPVTHYVLAYGLSEQSIEYGNQNIGDNQTTSFTVNHLSNGKKYYFRIRAVNECKPGELSDKLGAVPGVSTVMPQKVAGRPPVLSIYKSADTQTTVATASGKTSSTNTHKQGSLATASLAACTATCDSWKLLIAEALFLGVFFLLARLFTRIKISASLIIPLVMALVYIKTSGSCTSPSFFCKYFYPLTFIIYGVSVIWYKYVFTHSVQKAVKKKKKHKFAFVAI